MQQATCCQASGMLHLSGTVYPPGQEIIWPRLYNDLNSIIYGDVQETVVGFWYVIVDTVACWMGEIHH